MADDMSTPEGRRTILEIADHYDELAEDLEALAVRDPKRRISDD